MRSDAYGNIVSPFAAPGAPGDFRFEGFAPRSRVGAVADHPDNCVVTCARLWAWKGALLPHFVAPEHLLCGFTAFKLRKALNLCVRESLPFPSLSPGRVEQLLPHLHRLLPLLLNAAHDARTTARNAVSLE